MKTKFALLPLSIGFALTGCATLSATNNPIAGNSPEAQQAKHATKVAAIKGCAAGAGAGALLGILHGNLKQGIEYAVGGCVVGGVAYGAITYKRQLDQARQLAEVARENGATANLTTRQVQTQKDGQATEVDSLNQLTITFSPYKVLRHYPSVTTVAQRAAAMASASTVPVRIEVEGSSAERQWLMQAMQPNLTNPKVTIVQTFSTTPELVLSPVPVIAQGKE